MRCRSKGTGRLAGYTVWLACLSILWIVLAHLMLARPLTPLRSRSEAAAVVRVWLTTRKLDAYEICGRHAILGGQINLAEGRGWCFELYPRDLNNRTLEHRHVTVVAATHQVMKGPTICTFCEYVRPTGCRPYGKS